MYIFVLKRLLFWLNVIGSLISAYSKLGTYMVAHKYMIVLSDTFYLNIIGVLITVTISL